MSINLSLEQKKENVEPIKSKTYSLLGITSGRTVHVETSLVDEDKHTVASSPNLTRRLLLVSLGTLAVSVRADCFVSRAAGRSRQSRRHAQSREGALVLSLASGIGHAHHVHIGGVTINGALIGGIIVPGILVLAALLWPYLDKSPVSSVGVWLAKADANRTLSFS